MKRVNVQHPSAAEIELDQGSGNERGFTAGREIDFDKACCQFRCRRPTGGAPPLHVRLIAEPALTAECGGATA